MSQPYHSPNPDPVVFAVAFKRGATYIPICIRWEKVKVRWQPVVDNVFAESCRKSSLGLLSKSTLSPPGGKVIISNRFMSLLGDTQNKLTHLCCG